ncbi:MAG: phosphate ABC transporter permease PstA [Actinomycetia bacterium]|nr:phosphate ABC transporter permease PstA [Actinomycetes bacterium]
MMDQAKGQSRARKIKARLLYLACLSAIIISLGALAVLLTDMFIRGFGSLSLSFLTSFPSRFPAKAGIKSAIFGTIWMMSLTALFCIPIGISTAIFLEEYTGNSRLAAFIKINISNLAGVPSIVYGFLGLAVFVRALSFNRSVLSGSLTLALLVMPIVIVSSQEAIRVVPRALREASYALGGTRWQTIRRVVLPSSFPGIVTGVILALSRAIGETAPLIMIGALTFIAFVPDGPFSEFTALPIQIFNWVSRPQAGFHQAAAAGVLVLLGIIFFMNGIASIIRNRFERH